MLPNSSVSKLGDVPNLSMCKSGTIPPGVPNLHQVKIGNHPSRRSQLASGQFGNIFQQIKGCPPSPCTNDRQKCQGDPWQRMSTAEKKLWGAAGIRLAAPPPQSLSAVVILCLSPCISVCICAQVCGRILCLGSDFSCCKWSWVAHLGCAQGIFNSGVGLVT